MNSNLFLFYIGSIRLKYRKMQIDNNMHIELNIVRIYIIICMHITLFIIIYKILCEKCTPERETHRHRYTNKICACFQRFSVIRAKLFRK